MAHTMNCGFEGLVLKYTDNAGHTTLAKANVWMIWKPWFQNLTVFTNNFVGVQYWE